MAAETQFPDANIVQTNLVGAVTTVDEDADSPGGDWMTEVDDGNDTIIQVSFPSPTGSPTTGAGLQRFKIYCRRSTTVGGNDPTLDVALYEDGTVNTVLQTGISITSLTGQLVEVTWDATLLGTADGSTVELRCTGQRSGGSSADRRTVEFDALNWDAEFDTALAITTEFLSSGVALNVPTLDVGPVTLNNESVVSTLSLNVPIVATVDMAILWTSRRTHTIVGRS